MLQNGALAHCLLLFFVFVVLVFFRNYAPHNLERFLSGMLYCLVRRGLHRLLAGLLHCQVLVRLLGLWLRLFSARASPPQHQFAQLVQRIFLRVWGHSILRIHIDFYVIIFCLQRRLVFVWGLILHSGLLTSKPGSYDLFEQHEQQNELNDTYHWNQGNCGHQIFLLDLLGFF